MTTQQMRIVRRFHGPPDSGNGGYVCGLVAEALGGAGCTVTLHRPPPLEQQLELRETADGASLFDGAQLIASAVLRNLEMEVPAPPTLEEALAAEKRYAGHDFHHFPDCFVCGPERRDGDGLRIFPGEIGQGRVASSWTPDGNLLGAEGKVLTEFLWAGLDCPGYWAVKDAAGVALLGRMTAIVSGSAVAGEPLIVSGWGIASEGRKHHVGTALHDSEGRLIARARSTWVSINQWRWTGGDGACAAPHGASGSII